MLRDSHPTLATVSDWLWATVRAFGDEPCFCAGQEGRSLKTCQTYCSLLHLKGFTVFTKGGRSRRSMGSGSSIHLQVQRPQKGLKWFWTSGWIGAEAVRRGDWKKLGCVELCFLLCLFGNNLNGVTPHPSTILFLLGLNPVESVHQTYCTGNDYSCHQTSPNWNTTLRVTTPA